MIVTEESDRHGVGTVAECFSPEERQQAKRQTQCLEWAFETSETTTNDTPSHIIATSPNSVQLLLLTGDEAFKHMIL